MTLMPRRFFGAARFHSSGCASRDAAQRQAAICVPASVLLQRCLSLRLNEGFRTEPRIRSERTQGYVLGTLLDLDLVDPDGAGSLLLQDLLCKFLALGRVNTNPQNESPSCHERFQPEPMLLSKDMNDRHRCNAAGEYACKRGHDSR